MGNRHFLETAHKVLGVGQQALHRHSKSFSKFQKVRNRKPIYEDSEMNTSSMVMPTAARAPHFCHASSSVTSWVPAPAPDSNGSGSFNIAVCHQIARHDIAHNNTARDGTAPDFTGKITQQDTARNGTGRTAPSSAAEYKADIPAAQCSRRDTKPWCQNNTSKLKTSHHQELQEEQANA